MNETEVVSFLTVTTVNLRDAGFRGHGSLLLHMLHGVSYSKQRQDPGWGSVGLGLDLGENTASCTPEEGVP